MIARDVDAAKLQPAAVAPAATAPELADQQVRALFEEGSYEIVPHDNMRRIIAQRLTVAKQTVPHFYLTIDCALDKLLAIRAEFNVGGAKGQGRVAGL